MPALKEIAESNGTSLLAASPMWEQPVDQIIPAQVLAFVARNAALGRRDAAESAVHIALSRVSQAVDAGTLPRPAILNYTRPENAGISLRELRDGLHRMGDLKSAMVTFALEVGMDATEVSYLTYARLKTLRLDGQAFSELAEAALSCAPPRQLALQYVFWEDAELGMPAPVVGLDADIFDAFGMVWAELAFEYNKL